MVRVLTAWQPTESVWRAKLAYSPLRHIPTRQKIKHIAASSMDQSRGQRETVRAERSVTAAISAHLPHLRYSDPSIVIALGHCADR